MTGGYFVDDRMITGNYQTSISGVRMIFRVTEVRRG